MSEHVCDGRESVARASSSPAAAPGSPSSAEADREQSARVSRTLKSADYFLLFSVHNPDVRNVPIPSPRNPDRLIGMKVYEELHRFAVNVERPVLASGLHAMNQLGSPAARLEIDWRVIPEDFVAAPDRLPPPTELDPGRSQRFAMYHGNFRWKDRDESSFHGFGAGRTLPTRINGEPRLHIGAVVDILEGFGQLKGLQGNVVVNGFISPPYDLALNILLRVIDPTMRMKASTALPPLRPIPEADPSATFMVFLGQPDPDRPIVLDVRPGGRVVGASVHELLRLVHVDFDVASSKGLRSLTTEGPIVGALSFKLRFDSQDPRVPTPFTTTDAVFTFFDRDRQTVGTLSANVVEGRGFATVLQGAPPPVVRVVGFGPIVSGTGPFCGVIGMLSLNGIISISARTPSIMYVLRLSDPQRRFRKHWS